MPGTAHLVKTLNHIGYHEIEELARPTGAPGRTAPGRTAPGRTAPGRTAPGRTAPGRTALGVAGDYPSAVAGVAAFIDNIGFTPIIIGELAAGAILQPGSPLFGANLNEQQLRRELAAADVTPHEPSNPLPDQADSQPPQATHQAVLTITDIGPCSDGLRATPQPSRRGR